MDCESLASIPSVRHYSVRFVRYRVLGTGDEEAGEARGAREVGEERQMTTDY